MLMAELRQELPAIMHKCCTAYLSAVAMYGSKDLWGKAPTQRPYAEYVLPSYFHENKEALKRTTHLLEDFLKNKTQVRLVPASADPSVKRVGMPFETPGKNGTLAFKALANAYFKQQRDGKDGGFQWKEDKYRTVFDDNGIVLGAITEEDMSADLNVYNGERYPKHTKWLWGVVAASVADDEGAEAE